MVYKTFIVVCSQCRHRNLPHRSPRKGITLAFLDKLPDCRGCEQKLSRAPDESRDVVVEVKCGLIEAGFLTADGQIVTPPPAGDPLEVAERGNWRKQLSRETAQAEADCYW